MSENIKVTFDTAEEDLHVNLDAGAIMYGKMQIGTTTTGESGTEAKVENVGSQTNAILNFTIPKGDKGEQGEKGEKGDTGSPVEVKDIPANTNVDDFFEEGTYAWNGDDGKAITGLPNDIVDMPSFSYMLKITKHSTMTNEKNKFEHYFQEFWLEGLFIYTRKITVRTGLETGRIFYERYSWERKALVNYDGVTVVSTEPTNETEKAKVWLQKNKNLFNKNDLVSGNNCTYSISGNSIVINAAGANAYVKTKKYNLLANTYTLSGTAISDDYIGLAIYVNNSYFASVSSNNLEKNFTLTEDSEVVFRFYASSSSSSTTTTATYSNIQLEVGSSASAFEENVTSTIYTKENDGYEKFTETVAISSHQPINQNGLWLQKSNNIFNIEEFVNDVQNSGFYARNGNNLIINATDGRTSGFTYYVKVEKNKTYTLSTESNVGFRVYDYGNSTPIVNVNGVKTATFTPTTNLIAIKFITGNTLPYTVSNVMLNVGNEKIAFEEYKNKKIYTKKDNGGYEEFANLDESQNDYSLAETKIGTWVDGKPLYRKVLVFSNGTGEVTGTNGKVYNLSDFGIANADEIHFVQPSYYMHNGNRMPFPFYDGQTYAIQVYPTQLRIICTYAEIAVNKMVITLQYTKTTDVATISLEE